MPTVAPNVSTLTDLLRLTERVFSLLGDGTPILIGAQYEHETGPGSAPRVLFIADDTGALGPPTKLNAGYLASWSHGCRVRVRGAEAGDDAGRLEAAVRLAGRVMGVLKALDPGHVVLAPGGPKDSSPLRVDGAPGAEISFAFVYTTNIATEPEILRAVGQLTSISPPNPDQPGGSTGKTFVVGTTTPPDRE